MGDIVSDIVYRLRRMADLTTTDNDLTDIGRAADEIERLRRFLPKGDALQVPDLQQMIENRDFLLEEYRKLLPHMRGCICPPTSEKTCENQLCQRRGCAMTPLEI